MKKISFILLVLLCWSSMVSAQENNNRLRKKYRNLSFVKQEFEPAYYFGMDQTLKSNFGAAFTVGRTFYLHKKPIAGLIRFGLDATWFDLNYTNYKLEYRWEDNYDEEEEPACFPVVPVATISVPTDFRKSMCLFRKATISAFFPSCAITAIFII